MEDFLFSDELFAVLTFELLLMILVLVSCALFRCDFIKSDGSEAIGLTLMLCLFGQSLKRLPLMRFWVGLSKIFDINLWLNNINVAPTSWEMC